MEIGKEYRIKHVKICKNNRGVKSKRFNFKGILVGQTRYFYIFKAPSGYLECFLKTDFKNGEYVYEVS